MMDHPENVEEEVENRENEGKDSAKKGKKAKVKASPMRYMTAQDAR